MDGGQRATPSKCENVAPDAIFAFWHSSDIHSCEGFALIEFLRFRRCQEREKWKVNPLEIAACRPPAWLMREYFCDLSSSLRMEQGCQPTSWVYIGKLDSQEPSTSARLQ